MPIEKVILAGDRIISIIMGDKNVGVFVNNNLSSRIGIERIRVLWDSEAEEYYTVDLEYHTPIYVLRSENTFTLHAEYYEGVQEVENLKWSNRKNLIYDESTQVIRLKTSQESNDDVVNELLSIARAKMFSGIKKEIGGYDEQIIAILVLLFSIIVYTRTGNQKLEDFFDDIIPDIKEIFPLEKVDKILKESVKLIKEVVEAYWEEKDKILLEVNVNEEINIVEGGAGNIV
jgi:hypothetical protein